MSGRAALLAPRTVRPTRRRRWSPGAAAIISLRPSTTRSRPATRRWALAGVAWSGSAATEASAL
jgi:hypothetical protein